MTESVHVPDGRPTVHTPPAGSGPPAGLSKARRIVTTAWLVATGVQVAVWLVICVTTLSLDAPWWLWTLVAGALVVGALRVVETSRASADTGRQP